MPTDRRHSPSSTRGRPRRPLRVRQMVQFVTVAVVLLIGWQFLRWVGGIEAGLTDGARPGGVEGFLPIASIIALRHWLQTGEFSLVHPAGLVILVLVLLTGLLLKKAFCSWLCPVGTLAEYLARLSHLVFGRRHKLPWWLDYPLQGLKYLLLGFFLYAIFITMSREQVAGFLASPYNRVADIKMLWFFTDLSATAAWVLGILALLSFLLPYFWCRYLCPYGALLGPVSLLSPLKVRRSAEHCTNCGQCASVCPSFLAVDRGKTVHSVECTGCLECVGHCPEKRALTVPLPGRPLRPLRPAVFGLLVVLLFYGGIQVAKLAGRWESTIPQEELVERVEAGLTGPEYDHVGRPPSHER